MWIIHSIIDSRGVEFGWRRNLNFICWKTCFIYAKTSRTSDESGLEMPKPVYLQGWTVQSQVLLLEPTCSRFWNIFQWTCFIIHMKAFQTNSLILDQLILHKHTGMSISSWSKFCTFLEVCRLVLVVGTPGFTEEAIYIRWMSEPINSLDARLPTNRTCRALLPFPLTTCMLGTWGRGEIFCDFFPRFNL